MRQKIARLLEEHPPQEVWWDRSRPSNSLAGVRELRKRLNALVAAYEQVDDLTWRLLENELHGGPTYTHLRADTHVRMHLDKLDAAFQSAQRLFEGEKRGRDPRHPPTKDAVRVLVGGLVDVFRTYAPKKSKNPKDEATECYRFVRRILTGAGVRCPNERRLKHLIAQAQR